MRLRTLSDPDHLPALDLDLANARPASSLGDDDPPPRILLLYGSLRERSFSRLAVEEAARCCASSVLKPGFSIPRTSRCPTR